MDPSPLIESLDAPWQNQHDGRLASMIEVALAAADSTLAHFGTASLQIDVKADDSPVTIADREAEKLTRRMLAERFPDDAVAGEEYSDTTGESGYRWIVDPIDGTKSFVCGVPLYSTLLAIEHLGLPLAGIIVIPALKQAAIGSKGLGAFYTDGMTEWLPASVSTKTDLSRAVFVNSEVGLFQRRGVANVYDRLQEACWVSRTWGDGYGYLMVATGRADVMIDPMCNAWDVGPVLPILTEAGGKFTDWNNNGTIHGGDGVGTNGHLHEAVLELLKA